MLNGMFKKCSVALPYKEGDALSNGSNCERNRTPAAAYGSGQPEQLDMSVLFMSALDLYDDRIPNGNRPILTSSVYESGTEPVALHITSLTQPVFRFAEGCMYSRTRLERPPHWPQKCGLSRQVVSGDRFRYIEL